MGNGADGKHDYFAVGAPRVRIYSEAPVKIVIGGFGVTNTAYVERLEAELAARYKVVRKGENNRGLPKNYRMPRCIVIQDTLNNHGDLAAINFGPNFTEIVNTGKKGSEKCVEFLTGTKSLLDGLSMSSRISEDAIRQALKAAYEELFVQ